MIFNIPLTDLMWLALVLICGGAVTGVFAGLFGVGGGAILVAVLYQLFGMIGIDEAVRMHLSVGTSLGVIIPTSISSLTAHNRRGAVDREVLRKWAVPVIAGVVLGSILAAFVSGALLRVVFVILSLTIVGRMTFGRDDWRLGDDLPGGILNTVFGFGIGLLSTLMGIGGGAFGNTILMAYGRSVHQAVATSSGLGVLISVPGAIGFMWAGWGTDGLPPLSLGFVSLIGVALLVPTSVLAAPLGVKLAHSFAPRTLKIAFALFLVAVSVRFIASLW